MDTCCESRTENKSYVRYDLPRFPVLMRSYGWRAETPALLGRRAYLHANGCGLLSCSGRLIAQLPAWDSQERAGETAAWTASKIEDGSWPVSAGQICFGKGRGSKLWGNGVAIGSTASSGQLPDRGRRHPPACRLFPGLRAANGGIRELSGHWGNYSLKGCGATLLAPKVASFLCLSAIFCERP